MSTRKEGVIEMPVMGVQDFKDFAERFDKYQVQKSSHNGGSQKTKESEEPEVVEVNGHQVRVGTTEHINVMLGAKTRKNSKKHILNSTHTDLFSDDFIESNSQDELTIESEAPSDPNSRNVYSDFNDVRVSDNGKYMQLKVEDNEGNKFGINMPKINDDGSLVALSVCNVEKLSDIEDAKFDASMDKIAKLVDEIHKTTVAEGKREWKPVLAAFEVDVSTALSELAEMDEYQKNDKPMLRFSEGVDNDEGYKVVVQPNSPLAKQWDKKWGNQHDSEVADKDSPKFGVVLKSMDTRSLGENDKHPIVLFGASEYENGRNSFHSEFSSNINKFMKGELDDEQAFFPQDNVYRKKTPVIPKEPSASFDI
jgi:hypothetical protein